MRTPLYKQLSEQLADQIRQGIYKTAEKLPSVRNLAKQQLVDLIYEDDLPFIEDDIYGDLGYSEQRPKAVKAFDTRGQVLLCSSVSKV